MAVTVNTSGTDSTLLKDWYGPMQQNDEALAQQANANEAAINSEAAARQTADNNITKTGGTIDTKISAFNTATVQPIAARVTSAEGEITNLWDDLRSYAQMGIRYISTTDNSDYRSRLSAGLPDDPTGPLFWVYPRTSGTVWETGLYFLEVGSLDRSVQKVVFTSAYEDLYTKGRIAIDLKPNTIYLLSVETTTPLYTITLLGSFARPEQVETVKTQVEALEGARIYQGTSAEAASATARTATISGFPSAYAAGQLVMMTFDGDINGTQDPVSGDDGPEVTLNINNLGAKPIYFEDNDAGTFAPDITIVYRDTPVLLVYDGYHWRAVMMDYARNAFCAYSARGMLAKQIVYSGICTTAATTAAKTVTIAGFPTTLSNELTVRVRFTNGITSGDSTTLNINGTGAKGVKVCSSIDGLGYFTGIGEGAEVVLTYNSTADVWVIAGSGLAWYADVAGQLYEDGTQANVLLPSFYNWAASVTTDTFTTITEDIDSTYGTMASIDFSAAAITPNTGYRRMISLSFVSGATATAFTVPSAWYFVGDDCEDGDFVPAANMRYDVLIEYRNGIVRGYVSGYEVTA